MRNCLYIPVYIGYKQESSESGIASKSEDAIRSVRSLSSCLVILLCLSDYSPLRQAHRLIDEADDEWRLDLGKWRMIMVEEVAGSSMHRLFDSIYTPPHQTYAVISVEGMIVANASPSSLRTTETRVSALVPGISRSPTASLAMTTS